MKKAIKIIAIIVVIVFLGFPVTLFYVDYCPYMYEKYSWEKDSEDPDMVKFQSPFYDFLSFFAVRSREFFYRHIIPQMYEFPSGIAKGYYVDEIKIENPVIVECNGRWFVSSYDMIPHPFIGTNPSSNSNFIELLSPDKSVTYEHRANKSRIGLSADFSSSILYPWEEHCYECETLSDSTKIIRFINKPESFLLCLVIEKEESSDYPFPDIMHRFDEWNGTIDTFETGYYYTYTTSETGVYCTTGDYADEVYFTYDTFNYKYVMQALPIFDKSFMKRVIKNLFRG